MKRITHDQSRFDVMRLLDEYARSQGGSIQDHANHADFLSALSRDLTENRSNHSLIHGLRIQAMFAHVAAALGKCTIIKEEDAGSIYAIDPDLCAPDFRIVTSDRREVLVEVKNYRPSDPTAEYTLKGKYFDSLRRYAAIFELELYVAIYWSEWRLWSLVSADKFDWRAGNYELSINEAMKRSEMNMLGDCLLGTVPPLALQLLADPAKSRQVDADGKAKFTIGTVELLAASQVIDNPIEKKIAWFLLCYGGWTEATYPVEVIGDEVISISFEVQPKDRANPDHEFEMIGFMSEMLSRQYNNMTATKGKVDLLIPKTDPDALGVMIPADYKGEKLRLWQFHMTASVPNTDRKESHPTSG